MLTIMVWNFLISDIPATCNDLDVFITDAPYILLRMRTHLV